MKSLAFAVLTTEKNEDGFVESQSVEAIFATNIEALEYVRTRPQLTGRITRKVLATPVTHHFASLLAGCSQ